MGLKGFYKRHENQILATALVLALLLFLGVRYDYYYDLNDDVTMKDLLSGVYTGEPEGHNYYETLRNKLGWGEDKRNEICVS